MPRQLDSLAIAPVTHVQVSVDMFSYEFISLHADFYMYINMEYRRILTNGCICNNVSPMIDGLYSIYMIIIIQADSG